MEFNYKLKTNDNLGGFVNYFIEMCLELMYNNKRKNVYKNYLSNYYLNKEGVADFIIYLLSFTDDHFKEDFIEQFEFWNKTEADEEFEDYESAFESFKLNIWQIASDMQFDLVFMVIDDEKIQEMGKKGLNFSTLEFEYNYENDFIAYDQNEFHKEHGGEFKTNSDLLKEFFPNLNKDITFNENQYDFDTIMIMNNNLSFIENFVNMHTYGLSRDVPESFKFIGWENNKPVILVKGKDFSKFISFIIDSSEDESVSNFLLIYGNLLSDMQEDDSVDLRIFNEEIKNFLNILTFKYAEYKKKNNLPEYIRIKFVNNQIMN